jgi:hypothetical protein
LLFWGLLSKVRAGAVQSTITPAARAFSTI